MKDTTTKADKQKECIAQGAEEYSAIAPNGFSSVELKVGTSVCLINHRWYEAWKEYAQESYDIQSKKSYTYFSHERPGELDNAKLLDSKTGQLKAGMYEHVDYDFVAKNVWKYLLERYGGGPEITRDVVCMSYGKQCVEVYPKEIWYITAESEEKKLLTISKSKTFKDLKVMLCGLLGVDEANALSKMKLYNWYDAYSIESGEVGSEVIFEDKDKLDGYAISDKSTIFVDPYGSRKEVKSNHKQQCFKKK